MKKESPTAQEYTKDNWRKLMRRKEEEHKEEMESLMKEHEQQRRVAELEIKKLRAKLNNEPPVKKKCGCSDCFVS